MIVLVGDGHVEIQTQREGRKPCEDGDRNHNEAAICQGTPRIASNHRRERHRTDSPSETPEGTNPVYTLISES